ncbi:MAG TPA: sporulation integral membrane protein YlbJ [Firmicutes bacterium]|nr:sporulation integral membrane protein YlbJ [Bacillota bacterium]
MSFKRMRPYFIALATSIITAAMIFYPDVAFEAAVEGLDVWWEIVFPALLPFFICAELLMGLGVVHFMGVLLEPLMRPLFDVPGVGSFVLAMGLASGYPGGAVLTAKMRKEKLCSRTEAERLLCFTNTADPLFMTGAVAVGMFGDASLGKALVLSHYLSALILGVLLRFWGNKKDRVEAPLSKEKGSVVTRALRALISARRQDGRPFGQLLGDSVKTSVATLLMVGGFIILFSVAIRMLAITGLTGLMARAFFHVLGRFGLHPGTLEALVCGTFEITLGTQLASQASAPLSQNIMAASAIIAWSGLSVHAQVAAVVQDTDIRITPYVVARLIQAIIAALLVLHVPISTELAGGILPAWSEPAASGLLTWADRLSYFGRQSLSVLGILCVVCVAVSALNAFRARQN